MKRKTKTQPRKRGTTEYVVMMNPGKGFIEVGTVTAFTPEQARTRALDLSMVQEQAKRAGHVTLLTLPKRSVNAVTILTKTTAVEKEPA